MKNLTKALIAGVISATLLTTTAFAAVPVRSTFEELGFTVNWDQQTKTVTLTNGDFTFSEVIGENFKLENDTTTTTEEYATSIIDAWKKEALSAVVTITEINKDGSFWAQSEKLGEVVFKTDENTSFHHEMNRMAYRFENLEVGKKVKVYYAEAMTLSLPPQVYATEVVFLNEEVNLSMTGTIIETGEGFVLAETENGEVMFKFDENTNLHHEMNRMFYAFTDLTKGMKVTIYHSEAMTLSLPPQTYATEIVIMNEEVQQTASLTKTGKITEIGEDYFVIETENGEYQFNCSEETNIHHIMNRRLYRFEDLTKDMEVEVVHADAATFSLPPQSAAIEVIIK